MIGCSSGVQNNLSVAQANLYRIIDQCRKIYLLEVALEYVVMRGLCRAVIFTAAVGGMPISDVYRASSSREPRA